MPQMPALDLLLAQVLQLLLLRLHSLIFRTQLQYDPLCGIYSIPCHGRYSEFYLAVFLRGEIAPHTIYSRLDPSSPSGVQICLSSASCN